MSTNSGDKEPLTYHQALDIIKSKFFKDFRWYDVIGWSFTDQIFTAYERKYINAMAADEEEQVSRLFAILRLKNPSKIQVFLDAIRYDYDWLVDDFENLCECDSQACKDINSYVDLTHSLQSTVNLKFPDYNVHRSAPFIKLRNALLRMPRDGRVVLASDFGCGKKWLAIDACTDYEVAKAMNFNIYWIDMSQCTSSLEDLRMLGYLKLLLTQSVRSPSPASYGSLDCAEQDPLAYRNSIAKEKYCVGVELNKPAHNQCLVVLVNVQNTHALTAFNLPCKLLVITRSKKVSDSFAKSRSVAMRLDSGLTREEVYMLFEKYLEEQCEERNVELVFQHSNGHPYLLSLIAQSLRQKSSSWKSWIDKLQESDLTDVKFNAAIEKSLDSLEPDLRQMFCKTFRCFPTAIFVPQEVIAVLWHGRDIQKDLEKLHRHGFLEKFISPDSGPAYTLPFIYGKMDKMKERDEVYDADIEQMHRKLIEHYRIAEDLAQRKEVLLFKRHVHDFYFFLCLGYHIKKAGLIGYFRKLYLDFGFLEQKLRTVGLLNTIADLDTFRPYIATDPQRRKVFRAIREFLPNVEKTLLESENATLLQCALMEGGYVGSEASAQAAAFPEYAWFDQRGFFHQRHSIITLPKTPKKVILLDHERCLIVLEQSKNLLLVNTSLDWNTQSVKLRDVAQVQMNIVDARFCRDSNADIILALYDNGDMKLWFIPGDCNADRRRSDSFVRPQSKEIECSNVIPRAYSFEPISAFDIQLVDNNMPPILHLAYKSGRINMLQWQRDSKTFESMQIPPLRTQMHDICIVRLICHIYYVVGTRVGEVRVWKSTDSSNQRGLERFTHFVEDIELSRYEHLLVCRCCIVRFTGKSANHSESMEYLLNEVSLPEPEQSVVNCAKLLNINQHKQLVLGTNKGLVIFDLATCTKVLTTNVNEEIICVDVHPLENIKCKYVVACGPRTRKLLNLFALCVDTSGGTSLEWSHRATATRCERKATGRLIGFQLAPAVWLKGGTLYAAQYEQAEATLLAVDSLNTIHKIDTNGHSQLMKLPHTITAITLCGAHAFAGCTNGDIIDITVHAPLIIRDEAHFDGQAIEFLQLLDEQTLVAASSSKCVIFTDCSTGQYTHYDLSCGGIKRCFRLMAGYLVIVFKSCVFWILDACARLIYKYEPMAKAWIGDCDMQNKHLFIVTANYRLHIYDLGESLAPEKPKIVYRGGATSMTKIKASCLAATRDASLVAVGSYAHDSNDDLDVNIDVYSCQYAANRNNDQSLELMYRLKGHRVPINAMRFSPNAYVLVSCAEQMCWWSMQMAACKLNNTLTTHAPKRMHNSRFHSADSTESDEDEEVDASLARNIPAHIFEELSRLPLKDDRPCSAVTPVDRSGAAEAIWKTKRGPAAHCELLSCIKFNGSKAQQFFANDTFTQFQTIDNESGYYVLTLRDFSSTPSSSPLPAAATLVDFDIPVRYKAELCIDDAEYGEGGVDVVI